MFNINIQRDDNTVTVAVSGRIDNTNSEELHDQIDEALAHTDTGLALDVAGLEYISSSGLWVVLKLSRTMQRQHGRFAIGAPREHVREIIHISGFDRRGDHPRQRGGSPGGRPAIARPPAAPPRRTGQYVILR